MLFHANYDAGLGWMWTFVDLFFVLSGFLITRIILIGLKQENFSLKNFMIRRVLRIWPVYYLTLILCYAVVFINYVETGQPAHTSGVITAPFFLQYTHHYLAPALNAGNEDFIYWFHHSWSIAVEEQFYLLMPLLLLVLRRRLHWACVAIALAIPVAIIFRLADAFRWLLVYRMDALCIGVLIAFYWIWSRENQRRVPKLVMIAVALLGIHLITLEFTRPETSVDLTRALTLHGFNLVFGVILIALIDGWSKTLNALLSSRTLVFLGSISYALYLFHVPVRGVLLHIFDEETVAAADLSVQAVYFLTSITMAAMSKMLIENRFERLKHRFPVYTLPNSCPPRKGTGNP